MSDGHDQEDEKPRTVEQVNPGRVKPRKQEEELPTAAKVMEVNCMFCGDVIAVMIADTRRKEFNQEKDAVCKECYNMEESS